jgi:putative addiction module component (TIGR02574 family)
MSTDSSHVFDAALGLSDADRASLAYRLLQSLRPPGGCSDTDPRFELELERRVADYESGKTQASEWIDVASRLREALDKKEST